MTAPNLKARNAGLLGAFVLINVLVILAITLPDWRLPSLPPIASDPRVDEWLNRVGLGAIATISLTVLNNLIPSDWKAILVFWRFRHTLPGHRAFSHFARADSRVHRETLRARLGQWPTSPRDQNSTWYKLLKAHESTPHISAGHRVFLLLRDLSALILLLAIAALGTRLAGASWRAISWVETVLLVEYLLAMVSARNAANRLVVNVLAQECTQA